MGYGEARDCGVWFGLVMLGEVLRCKLWPRIVVRREAGQGTEMYCMVRYSFISYGPERLSDEW